MAKFKDGDTVGALIDIEIDLTERDSFIIKKGDQFPLNKFLAETWGNGRFAVKDGCGLVNESDFKLVGEVMIESYKYVGKSCDYFTNGYFYEFDLRARSFLCDDEGDIYGYTLPDVEFELVVEYTNQEMIDRIEMAKSINGFEEEKVAASETQIAGNHYSKLKIQPMEYCLQNDLNYGQSNTIKYITRYKDKNGIEDLKKAIHCIELLIEFEEKDID
jgi:hypothetical protein